MNKKAEEKPLKKVEGKTSQRAEGKTSQKAEGKTSQMAEGKTSQKAEGKTSQMAEGKTSQRAEGKTSQRAEGKTSQKAEGKTSQRAEGKTSQKAEGKTSQRAEGKTSQMAEGKTSQMVERKILQMVEEQLAPKAGLNSPVEIDLLMGTQHHNGVWEKSTALQSRNPTIKEWTRLYDAAVAFKQAKCWKWMYDNDLFGVMDPETGKIAYCCIMGNCGEHYALGAYLEAKGLSWLLELFSHQLDTQSFDIMLNQNCLMASFENRNALTKKDYAIVKELGWGFRGKNQWPLFRVYEPGYFPWFLNDWECRFLTVVLEQALEVALRCQADKYILEHNEHLTFMVKVPEVSADGVIWHDRYLQTSLPPKVYPSWEITDQLLLQRVNTSRIKREGVWEIDMFYAPFPYLNERQERPYYPLLCLILDGNRGFILGNLLLKSLNEEGYKIIETLLTLFQDLKTVPTQIIVTGEDTYHFFRKSCQQLKIPLKMVQHSPLLEEVRKQMLEDMEKNPF